MARYAELVGKKQIEVESYEEVMENFAAAKLLVLTNQPDALILSAESELPKGK